MGERATFSFCGHGDQQSVTIAIGGWGEWRYPVGAVPYEAWRELSAITGRDPWDLMGQMVEEYRQWIDV
jgi:hypothetical protein